MTPLAWAFAAGGAVALGAFLVCMIADPPAFRPWRQVTERDGEPWFEGKDVALAIDAVEALDYRWREYPDWDDWCITIFDSTVPHGQESALISFEGPDLNVLRRQALGWFWHEGNSKARN